MDSTLRSAVSGLCHTGIYMMNASNLKYSSSKRDNDLYWFIKDRLVEISKILTLPENPDEFVWPAWYTDGDPDPNEG